MLRRLATAGLLVWATATAAGAETCPPAPSPVRDLALARYYTDAEGSTVDPAKEAALRGATQPLTDYVSGLTKLADRAWQQRSNPSATFECGLDWLQGWAKAGAYLGRIEGKQAEAQRRWDLAGMALAYLKLKHRASPEQRSGIEPWLIAVADAARAAFDDVSIKRNNHWYWMGLGLAATALATGSERHWLAARGIMADAGRDIAADGSLPLELARKSRALHYHSFALMPLVAMAELAAVKGEDWYAPGDGALHRLVALTAKGLAEPSVFDAIADTVQERPVKPAQGWPALYAERFPAKLVDRVPQSKDAHRWLGGDVFVLRHALQRKSD